VLVGASYEPNAELGLITELGVNLVLVYAGAVNINTVRIVRQIRSSHPGLGVIVMGLDDCEATILEYIEAGASGYILKSASVAEVLTTIEVIHAGQTQCSPRIIAAVFKRVRQLSQERDNVQASLPDALTPREKVILEMIAVGLVNKEIAHRLGIKVCTVKSHVHNILDKLRVKRRHAAIRCASMHGILDEPVSCSSGTSQGGPSEI
jgi:DNA-binding NarL/FixJ family response regulator